MRNVMRRVLPLAMGLCAGLARAQSADPALAPPTYPSLKLGGFADINFFTTDQKSADPRSGFNEGQFVLHFTSALAPRISFFGELSLTARPTGFVPVVERVIIRWDASDSFKLSAGRYHTPINYWNTAFHHGQWLQTSVSRPEMTKFGGQFIPVHFVGGLVEGAIPAGGLNLNYKVGVGNGRFSDISGGGDSGDVNNNRAVLASLTIRPDALYHLQAGGAFYRDEVTLTGKRDFDESITSAYAVWLRETPEVIVEYTHVSHKEIATGTTYGADAFYVQLAYRLPVLGDRFKPYIRYESIDTRTADAVYAAVPDFRGTLGGIRYDFSDYVAVKGEFRRQRPGTERYFNALFIQISYAF